MSDLLLVGLTLACFALLALGTGVLDRRLTDDRPAPTPARTASGSPSRSGEQAEVDR